MYIKINSNFNKMINKNRAFVKYKKNGEIVPGSLIVTNGGYPKGGPYKEISTDLCCEPSFGIWKVVTGGIAGEGVVLIDDGGDTNKFTIVGPDDDSDNGWVYLKTYFPSGAELNIDYNWISFDEGTSVDRPVFWTSTTEPTGIPDNLTSQASATPQNDTWNIIVAPGEWFAVGIYSSDSCCGRGVLRVDFNL